MEAKHVKSAQITGEQLEPCEKGNEVLQPRDLAAYLRTLQAEEEAGELPPEKKRLPLEARLPEAVNRHLQDCTTCTENWNFLKKTDPILRAVRKKRVGVIIRSVMAAEAEDMKKVAAMQEFREDLATADKTLPSEQQDALMKEFQQALSSANLDLLREARSVAHAIPGDKPHESGKQVCAIAAKIGEIRNNHERFATAHVVCGLFRDVYTEWKKKSAEGKLPLGLLDTLMVYQSVEGKSMVNEPKWIDLSTLKPVPLDVATTFFCSFPEAIRSGSTDLFDTSGTTIRFNWARCQELREEPNAAIAFKMD